jgi:hypothetical protein
MDFGKMTAAVIANKNSTTVYSSLAALLKKHEDCVISFRKSSLFGPSEFLS